MIKRPPFKFAGNFTKLVGAKRPFFVTATKRRHTPQSIKATPGHAAAATAQTTGG